MAWNVVIAGGGFGGLYAARKLERALPRHSARITLVTTENSLLYSPLLPGAASGTLEPRLRRGRAARPRDRDPHVHDGIETEATLRVRGHEAMWAIGDGAAVPDPAARGKRPCPPTAQHALRQGRLVGRNVAAALGGRKPRKSATAHSACSWTWAATRR